MVPSYSNMGRTNSYFERFLIKRAAWLDNCGWAPTPNNGGGGWDPWNPGGGGGWDPGIREAEVAGSWNRRRLLKVKIINRILWNVR